MTTVAMVWHPNGLRESHQGADAVCADAGLWTQVEMV